MKEEDKLLKKIGTGNPFTVPEGYFENLTSEIMNKLPEKEIIEEKTPTRWERFKPWAYMAAMFIGAAMIIRVASYNMNTEEDKIAATEIEAEMITDEYLDYALSQAMFDDYSLYVYLSEDNVD